MPKKICIISHLHLSTNPRVWKEANALAKNGYDITILTTWTLNDKLKQDYQHIHYPNIQYKCVINLIKEQSNFFIRNYYRTKRKILEQLKLKFGFQHQDFIVLSTKKYVQAALKENADLYIGHLEGGLVIANELLKYNKKVAFDFEDWYSKDFINKSRPIRLLESLERNLLQNACYVVAPSISMAEALNKYYKTNNKIEIIYNGFSKEENKTIVTKTISNKPRLVWFSQTVGAGRGIETLIESLQFLSKNVDITLIGNCSTIYKEKLQQKLPTNTLHSLKFVPLIPHNELLRVLANNDIGLALEEERPESRNVTITNKILQYLQANLHVIATSTKGQMELAKNVTQGIEFIELNNPKQWADKIELLINSNIKTNTQEIFNNCYSWEIQEEKILKLVNGNI